MNKNFYDEIRNILTTARNKVYQTANFAMVEAYWNIGKSIIVEQGGNEKADYGTGLLKELSKQMTQDFGKGFTVANLKNTGGCNLLAYAIDIAGYGQCHGETVPHLPE